MGAARIYKAFSPYPSAALEEIDYAQTADVVYTVHLDYPVYKYTRTAHTNWTSVPVTFGPTIAVPATPTGAASTPNLTGYIATVYNYKITRVGGDQEQESRASALLSLTNDLSLSGNFNTITLPAYPAGTDRTIIYKEQGGAYGYIGGTDGLSFVDGNPQLQPVLSDTPPLATNPFDAAGKYPSAVTFHDQRLMMARTRDLPNAAWGSQPSDFENMDLSRPAKPDDAISFALVGERVNSVNQLVSMDDLLAMTSNAIYAVYGEQSGSALTPAFITPKRQNSRAAGRLNPIVIDDVVFYRPNKGSSIRTLGFQFEVDGYKSNNISIFSPHFFAGFEILDWAYVEDPYSAIFMVRNDGALLCFTWEAEQQVWGFSLLETDGLFKRVAAISEGGYDRLYALVERTINGVTRKFHERLALPHVDDITTACHLDCAITQVYNPARNVIDGLYHLEGETVACYYDGYVETGLVVAGGTVTLPNGYAASVATVGLPYVGVIETLPLVFESRSGSRHVDTQNVSRMVVRCIDTRGIEVGITGTTLEAVTEREGGEIGLDDVHQRDYEVSPPGSWESAQTLTIEQNQPLPAHITGIFIEPLVRAIGAQLRLVLPYRPASERLGGTRTRAKRKDWLPPGASRHPIARAITCQPTLHKLSDALAPLISVSFHAATVSLY